MKNTLFAFVGLLVGAFAGGAIAFGLFLVWPTMAIWVGNMLSSCDGFELCGLQKFFGYLGVAMILGALAGAVAFGVVGARRRQAPRL